MRPVACGECSEAHGCNGKSAEQPWTSVLDLPLDFSPASAATFNACTGASGCSGRCRKVATHGKCRAAQLYGQHGATGGCSWSSGTWHHRCCWALFRRAGGLQDRRHYPALGSTPGAKHESGDPESRPDTAAPEHEPLPDHGKSDLAYDCGAHHPSCAHCAKQYLRPCKTAAAVQN